MCSKIVKGLAWLVAIMSLSSCSTISHTATTANVDTRVYNLTVADMDVEKAKSSATIDWKWNPIRAFSLSECKENAAARLLEETGSDVIVEPQYTVKRRGIFRGGTITVTGYPARYVNFHSMTPEEAAMINPPAEAVEPPVWTVATTAAASAQRVKRPAVYKPRQNDFVSTSFINLVGGADIGLGEGHDGGFNIGLMYGKTGRSWGWYTKLTLTSVNAIDYSYSGEGENNWFVGGNITAGVIKPFGRKFNVFAGVGVGTCEYAKYHSSYTEKAQCFSIPVDLGVMLRLSKFNVGVGVTYAAAVGDDNSSGNIRPFALVGFSF